MTCFINNFAIIQKFIELEGKIPPPQQEFELPIDPTVIGLNVNSSLQQSECASKHCYVQINQWNKEYLMTQYLICLLKALIQLAYLARATSWLAFVVDENGDNKDQPRDGASKACWSNKGL